MNDNNPTTASPPSPYQEERGKRQIQPNTQDPKQSRPILQPIILGTLTFASNPVQTTVGTAGSAAALPLNPTGYLQFNMGNVNYLIPFYAVGSGVGTTTWLPLTGGTMLGAIAMGSNKITGLAVASSSGDALSWGQAFTAGNITFNPTTSGLVGTATNDNATTGNVGEYISSAYSSVNAGSTTAWTDATSISLTAGDWNVTHMSIANQAAVANVTGMQIGVSTTTGNSSSGLVSGTNLLTESGTFLGSDITSMTIANYRVSIASTTIHYAKINATYTGTAPQFNGILSARRAR